MTTQIYDVESQSKYHMKLTRIENIEDAGDHFVTSDELDEMGISSVSCYSVTTFDEKIKTELRRLVKKLKAGTARTIKIDDELVEMFGESGSFASDYVEGIRRVGNRLSLHTNGAKTKSKATKRDGKRFITLAVECMLWKFNGSRDEDDSGCMVFDVRGGTEIVTEHAFNFIRHNITWKEFEKWLTLTDEHGWKVTIYEDDIIWYKDIYNNPKQFNEPA